MRFEDTVNLYPDHNFVSNRIFTVKVATSTWGIPAHKHSESSHVPAPATTYRSTARKTTTSRNAQTI